MRIAELDASQVAGQPSLRMDAKYRLFWAEGGGLFPSANRVSIPLGEFLVERPTAVVKKSAATSPVSLIELDDVEQRTGAANPRTVEEIGSDKMLLDGWDLFTNRIRPYLGKTFVSPGGRGVLGSTEWIPLKCASGRIEPEVVKAMLLSDEYLGASGLLMSGKNQPRISEFDLCQLRIPCLTSAERNQLVTAAGAARSEIARLAKTLRCEADIIDAVLSKGLGISQLAELRRTYGKGMTNATQALPKKGISCFCLSPSQMTSGFAVRFSTRFLRPQAVVAEAVLRGIGATHARKWLLRVRKGDQPAYEEDGAIRVVKTGNMQEGKVDFTDCERVSAKYFATRRATSGVNKGDVLLASTGFASLGKLALYSDELPALASVDLLILEFDKKKADPRFFVYFMRTALGFFQMEREFTGATNQIHFYPEQASSLLVPDISKEKQKAMADEIDRELDSNNAIKERIATENRKVYLLLRSILGLPKIENDRTTDPQEPAVQ